MKRLFSAVLWALLITGNIAFADFGQPSQNDPCYQQDTGGWAYAECSTSATSQANSQYYSVNAYVQSVFCPEGTWVGASGASGDGVLLGSTYSDCYPYIGGGKWVAVDEYGNADYGSDLWDSLGCISAYAS